MKRSQYIFLVIMIVAGLALAQNTQQTPSQTPPPPQVGQQTQAQTAPAPPPGKTPPEAKTQDEFKAYQDAFKLTDAAAAEKAADEFAAKYPTSELRYLLYYRALNAYQNQNNAEKAIDMGRKVLAINPNEPITLAMLANFIAEKTRETDIDRDQRLNEAMTDANKALQYVDTELVVPANVPQATVDANKDLLRSMAYAAIGNVYVARNDYPQAEVNLKKSIDLNKVQPDAVTFLRYSVVLDHQKKYPDAIAAASRALELSPPGSPEANLAKQQRDRLLTLTGKPVPAATAPPQSATPPPAATQAPPK